MEGKVSERRTIEYKRDLPSETYESKKDFLADVSSFANAKGGHIILGVQEKNGLPIAISGISCDDPDREVLRLENLLRDGIEPRLQGVSVKGILLSSGSYAFILRVPRSWSKPHVVNYSGHWRFYSRNSVGKYPLDNSEVRSAFLQSGTLVEKIRLFRDERLGSIITAQTPARLVPGGRTILHLIPYTAFETGTSFPLEVVANNPSVLKPITGPITNIRYNFDGLLSTSSIKDGISRGYVQLFRNGIIEAVDSSLTQMRDNKGFIPGYAFEKALIDSVNIYLDGQKQITVSPPIIIFISLTGVSGYTLAVNHRIVIKNENQYSIDRDTLLLPEVILERFPSDIARALRPAFDAVWNAIGFSSSLGYDENGEWGKGPNC